MRLEWAFESVTSTIRYLLNRRVEIAYAKSRSPEINMTVEGARVSMACANISTVITRVEVVTQAFQQLRDKDTHRSSSCLLRLFGHYEDSPPKKLQKTVIQSAIRQTSGLDPIFLGKL